MTKFSKFFIIVILLVLGLGGYVWQVESSWDKLEVIVLDIGQGDAILVKTPYKQVVLVDGGPDKSVIRAMDRNLPFWRRKIDLMLLTHPDADHVTGLVEVLKRYEVERVMGTGVVHTLPAYIEWLEIIKEEEIPMELGTAEKRVEFGEDLRLEVLWPTTEVVGMDVEDNNETSIVAKLIYGKTSFLLTGDATISVEEELMSNCSTSTDLQFGSTVSLRENYGASIASECVDLKSDVLKVGHHGSKGSTSLEFVEAVKPEYAVISVGADNQFGHPTRRVLKNLETVGAVILRTDLLGDVKFVSDGESVNYVR